jgi:O-antigen/teichoic acid export membrane protein
LGQQKKVTPPGGHGEAAATALCFSLAIAVYYKTKLQEEFRPFGPTYFWAKAAKSKQKPLVKNL